MGDNNNNEADQRRVALAKIEKIKEYLKTDGASNNFGVACFNRADYDNLPSDEDRSALLKIIKSGIENPTSDVGTYANHPTDYEKYRKFFNGVIGKYHKVPNLENDSVRQINDWNLASLNDAELPSSGELDLRDLGIKEPLSIRVRTARNLMNYPMPASMSRKQRLSMEVLMYSKVFSKLFQNPSYGGKYYTLTERTEWMGVDEPSVEFLTEARYQELVKAHIMFKSMEDDLFLKVAGISGHWPAGRGVYVSSSKNIIVWIGEEDHVRIISMKTGFLLNEVFAPLEAIVELIEKEVPGRTAKSDKFGIITSCPTNIGTGMRASVLIKLPFLTQASSKHPTDEKAKAIAKEFGLSVRGLGGEHTPVGADGTVDISPSGRFMVSENQVIANLYKGLKKIYAEEQRGSGQS